MRKYSWLIAIFAIFALAFAGFMACKGDEDDGNGTGKDADPQKVTDLSIPGVQAPEPLYAPVSVIGNHAQYTGTVAWEKTVDGSPVVDNKFSMGAYTATITLTAKSGWTFKDVAANSFTVLHAIDVVSAAGEGTSMVVTAKFDEYDPLLFDLADYIDDFKTRFPDGDTGAGNINGSYILYMGGGYTILEADTDEGWLISGKTLATRRGGSSHGLRLDITRFLLDEGKPGHTYTIKYGGTLTNLTSANDTNQQARLRLEDYGSLAAGLAAITPALDYVGGASTNVMALTTATNVIAGSGLDFDLEWKASYEQLKAISDLATTATILSIADVRHNSTAVDDALRVYSITYKELTITASLTVVP